MARNDRGRRRCLVPPKKIRYRTELDAHIALALLAGVTDVIRAYRCEFCRGWHTTSQRKGRETEL